MTTKREHWTRYLTVSGVVSRYCRYTDQNPKGELGHLKACKVHRYDVCTCGFLHDMAEIQALIDRCPYFWDEEARQDRALKIIRDVYKLADSLTVDPRPAQRGRGPAITTDSQGTEDA